MKILKFSSSWCSPCKALATQLKDYKDHVIESYDFDENPDDFMKYGIKKLPTLIVLNSKNEEMERSINIKSLDNLKEWINSIKNG